MTDQWPHHHTIKANQKQICSEGKKVWLKSQKKTWSCPECGTAIVWYQAACECGFQLDAWDLPDEYYDSNPD